MHRFAGGVELRIALVQQRAKSDRQANRQRGLQAPESASTQGAQLVCFAELAFEPFYPQVPATPEPLTLAEPVPGPTTQAFAQRARELGLL